MSAVEVRLEGLEIAARELTVRLASQDGELARLLQELQRKFVAMETEIADGTFTEVQRRIQQLEVETASLKAGGAGGRRSGIDTRTLGRPKIFSGKTDEWRD